MKTRNLILSVLALVLAAGLVAAVRPYRANLTGAAEVPNPGDPDGGGHARLTLDLDNEQVCFNITVARIATPTAAHIHVGEAGVAGGVVVNFDVANNGLSGCVDAARSTIIAIGQNPAGYYVNVHNADFPGGAVRGQLMR